MKRVNVYSLLIYITITSALFSQKSSNKEVIIKQIPTDTKTIESNPREGDLAYYDTETGDLILEYNNKQGTIEKYRIVKSDKIEPIISVKYQHINDGIFTYYYTLENGVTAKQHLCTFSIYLKHTNMINAVNSKEWLGSFTGRNPDDKRYSWIFLSPDYNEVKGILPGKKSSEDLCLKAPLLPGISKAILRGFTPASKYLEDASQWIRDKQYEALKLENTSYFTYTIAPKIILSEGKEEILRSVVQEIYIAKALKEFESMAKEIEGILYVFSTRDQKRILELKNILPNLGSTPLQKDFFNAIAFDLNYAEQLK